MAHVHWKTTSLRHKFEPVAHIGGHLYSLTYDVSTRIQGDRVRAPLSKHLPSPAQATPSDLLQALRSSRQPNSEYRCLNPECTTMCAWPAEGRRGRPSMYCSRKCREVTERTRNRLAWEVGTLEGALSQPDLSWEQQRSLQQALGHRKWAMERYPATTD